MEFLSENVLKIKHQSRRNIKISKTFVNKISRNIISNYTKMYNVTFSKTESNEYIDRSPINIFSDEELADITIIGSRITNNPYIIEYLHFSNFFYSNHQVLPLQL